MTTFQMKYRDKTCRNQEQDPNLHQQRVLMWKKSKIKTRSQENLILELKLLNHSSYNSNNSKWIRMIRDLMKICSQSSHIDLKRVILK